MSSKLRKRIKTLTGLFSLCPRNWKGAIALCGDFFLRSRNAKSAITEWFIFHELENKKARHGLGIDYFCRVHRQVIADKVLGRFDSWTV